MTIVADGAGRFRFLPIRLGGESGEAVAIDEDVERLLPGHVLACSS